MLISAGLISARAEAQSAEAEALFNEGDKLTDEGKLAQACEAFEASNRVETRAGTLIRLGQCREQTKQLASAWSAYKDALTRVKDPAKKAFALERSIELEPRLSYLTISVQHRVEGLAVTRNGKRVDPGLWNRAVPMDGGMYTITVEAPNFEGWKTTTTVPLEYGKARVVISKLKQLPTPIAKLSSETIDHPISMFTTKRKVAIGLASVGAASLITAITIGSLANNKESDAFVLCPDPQSPCMNADRANALVRSGHRLSIGADVVFGVAGLTAIGAGVLWFTGAPIVPSTNSVAVIGRF